MSSAPSRKGLELGDLQRWFLERIVAPHRTVGAPAPAPERQAADVILPSRTLTADQRIDIYSKMYLLRLCEVMAGEHPVIERLIGKNDFTELVRDYVSRYPSRGFTLNDLAHALPHYLKYHCKRDDTPLLLDIARLERAISDAYDTPHIGTLTADDLSRLPVESWTDLRFRMDPSVRIMAFDHAACDIVNAHHEDRDLPDLGPMPSWAVVWRHAHKIWRQPVTQVMYVILDALASGETLMTALERASEVWSDDEAELENNIFRWFGNWLNESYFSSYILPRSE